VYSLIFIRFFKPIEHDISVNKPTVMEDSFVSSTEIAVNGYTK